MQRCVVWTGRMWGVRSKWACWYSGSDQGSHYDGEAPPPSDQGVLQSVLLPGTPSGRGQRGQYHHQVYLVGGDNGVSTITRYT